MNERMHRMRHGSARARELCALALVILLVVILAVRVSPRLAKGSPPKSPAANPAEHTDAVNEHRAAETPPWPAGLRRDPFYREIAVPRIADSVAPLMEKPQFHIGSILVGHPSRAVINDKVVQEGDVIDGYQVKRIGRREVTLERDGSTFVLRL